MKINSSSLRSGGSDITCSPSLTRRSNIWVSVCYVCSARTNIVSVRALALRWKWTCVFVCMRECELIAMKSCFFGRWFTPPCNIFVCSNIHNRSQFALAKCARRQWMKRIVDDRWGERAEAHDLSCTRFSCTAIAPHAVMSELGCLVAIDLMSARLKKAALIWPRCWNVISTKFYSSKLYVVIKKRTAKGGWRYHI